MVRKRKRPGEMECSSGTRRDGSLFRNSVFESENGAKRLMYDQRHRADCRNNNSEPVFSSTDLQTSSSAIPMKMTVSMDMEDEYEPNESVCSSCIQGIDAEVSRTPITAM